MYESFVGDVGGGRVEGKKYERLEHDYRRLGHNYRKLKHNYGRGSDESSSESPLGSFI
jgi:hypothetical protein